MTTGALSPSPTSAPRARFGPWLWGPEVDLVVFGGTTLVALGLLLVLRQAGLAPGELPAWGWLLVVLGIDVAHVWSTLFRTYLDPEELRRHRLRYLLAPALAYGVGVALYSQGSLWFWRVLAYVAVFHFVRQQVGWVGLYRARANRAGAKHGLLDRRIDEFAIYAATLYPIVSWHAHLDQTRFDWFVSGDFMQISRLAQAVLPLAQGVWALALTLFFLRQLWLVRQDGELQLGKVVVVTTTALIWYVGIVLTNSDAEFTITNVLAHGVPYLVLLYYYARARRRLAPAAPGSRLMAGGVAAFLGTVLTFAFLEELLWDKLVWHEHSWLFGDAAGELGHPALTFLVPLLALPQFTHYLLDGLLWRQRDSRENAAQRAAIGLE